MNSKNSSLGAFGEKAELRELRRYNMLGRQDIHVYVPVKTWTLYAAYFISCNFNNLKLAEGAFTTQKCVPENKICLRECGGMRPEKGMLRELYVICSRNCTNNNNFSSSYPNMTITASSVKLRNQLCFPFNKSFV